MEPITESTLYMMNKAIINLVKAKANGLRPNIDWVQVQFSRNFQGQIIGLQSDDPELHQWLQRITIERNDANNQAK